MTGGYMAERNWLHRVPARVKLIALAIFSAMLFPVDDMRLLAGSLAVVCLIYGTMRRGAPAALVLLRPLLALLLLIGGIQALSGTWQQGVVVVLRLVTMVLLANLVTLTTTMRDIMEAIAPILRPLRYAGWSPKKLSLALALVLRFVPVLLSDWRAREEAWHARTARRVSPHVITAFVAGALRMADHVAEALDARGFDRSAQALRHD